MDKTTLYIYSRANVVNVIRIATAAVFEVSRVELAESGRSTLFL